MLVWTGTHFYYHSPAKYQVLIMHFYDGVHYPLHNQFYTKDLGS